MREIYVGIDPGLTNLGLSVVEDCSPGEGRIRDRFKNLHSEVFSVASYPSMERACDDVLLKVFSAMPGSSSEARVFGITIERYVPYDGKMTQVAEEINILIGMLRMAFHKYFEGKVEVGMVRAFDWKVALSQLLAKEGIPNPSTSLDKKFSYDAATSLCGVRPPTTHEADALCIASLPAISRSVRTSHVKKEDIPPQGPT